MERRLLCGTRWKKLVRFRRLEGQDGGEVGASTVYMMWDAKQGGGFNYPYVQYASFNVSSGPATSISVGSIWNASYAWAYPGMESTEGSARSQHSDRRWHVGLPGVTVPRQRHPPARCHQDHREIAGARGRTG